MEFHQNTPSVESAGYENNGVDVNKAMIAYPENEVERRADHFTKDSTLPILGKFSVIKFVSVFTQIETRDVLLVLRLLRQHLQQNRRLFLRNY